MRWLKRFATPWLVCLPAILVSSACYPTYERSVAAVNVRDWPTAEAELWGYLQGPDCTGRWLVLECKQAMVLLGEVLLEDDRPIFAASVFRSMRRQFVGTRLGTIAVEETLERRIADGLAVAKERWDRFRSGVPGKCVITAHFRNANRLPFHVTWSELDLDRISGPATAADAMPLFEETTTAGAHVITIGAMYTDRTTRYRYDLKMTHYRSCDDGERMDLLFERIGNSPDNFNFNVKATGGKETPREGPLRPLPSFLDQ